MIKMFRDRSRIRKVAIVEDGAAMLPKTFEEMALGLPNALFAAFLTAKKENRRSLAGVRGIGPIF